MNQVIRIILTKFRIVYHQIISIKTESKLKVAVVSISAIGLWLGAFFLFEKLFQKLINYTGYTIGNLFMSHLLSVLALFVFLLLIFSNILISFSTLYRSKEVIYYIQSPLQFRHFFYARFAECIVFSSWALVYLVSQQIIFLLKSNM